MILRLIELLDRFGASIETPIPVTINEHNEFVFNETSSSAVRRFIRDVYGNDKIEELEEDGEDPYSYTAEVVMERLKTNVYNFTSRWPAGQELDKETVLKLCNVRYAMSANAYSNRIPSSCSNSRVFSYINCSYCCLWSDSFDSP